MIKLTTIKHWACAVLLALSGVASAASVTDATNSLPVGQQLNAGQRLASINGTYHFNLQGDGNLVIYSSAGKVIWAANTNGKGGTRLVLQSDGNLVLYTSAGKAVMATGTVGKGAAHLIMKNDGNLVLANASGAAVWETKTSDGSGGGGTTPSPSGYVRVAFVGDSKAGDNFQHVLNLIKSEGANMTMFLGDTSYASRDDHVWDSKVRATLGPSDPVLLALGNHDVDDSDRKTVVSLSQSRLNSQKDVKCKGTYGQRMTCTYENLYFVVSGIGTIGSIADSEDFIESSLNAAPANAWRICAWHKNMQLMQVGGKTDEVSWKAYELCRKKGAFIATGHEHSYSRTHLLSSMKDQTVASTESPFTVSPGKSFAVVSGLGGNDIRDQKLHGDWWAKVYTKTQNANFGVLFGDFYADHANFYFKNIDGHVIDKFTVKKGY